MIDCFAFISAARMGNKGALCYEQEQRASSKIISSQERTRPVEGKKLRDCDTATVSSGFSRCAKWDRKARISVSLEGKSPLWWAWEQTESRGHWRQKIKTSFLQQQTRSPTSEEIPLPGDCEFFVDKAEQSSGLSFWWKRKHLKIDTKIGRLLYFSMFIGGPRGSKNVEDSAPSGVKDRRLNVG